MGEDSHLHDGNGFRVAMKYALPGVLLAAAVLVPFREKAFTIDDHVFMFMAEHAVIEPLHPSAIDMVWGDAPGRVSLASGPVMPWLLVPSALANGSEAIAHLAQLVMFALAIVSTVALAMRLGVDRPRSAVAGILLASTPAALGMAGTAMPDVPAMALGVAGIERLVAWSRERRAHQAVMAAVALGLAPLARPHMVLALGVGALLLAGDLFGGIRRESFGRSWAPLVAAPVVTAVIALATRDPHQGSLGLVAAAASVSSLGNLARNAVAFPLHWALALPLALPWILVRPRAVMHGWWLIAAAAGSALPVLGWNARGAVLAAIAGVSIGVLWSIGAEAWRARDSVQLTLAAWLLVALATLPYPHLPSKYLLASAPAAAILVARATAPLPARRGAWVVGVTCVLGVALGVGILAADAAFAGLGRRAAAELIAPQVTAGHRVWFAGHWGFQWYAEKAGGRPLTLTPPFPDRGDLVVTSRATEVGPAILSMLHRRFARATLLATIEEGGPGGRVMDASVDAGFFSPGWGYLPWAWGNRPLDTFQLWHLD